MISIILLGVLMLIVGYVVDGENWSGMMNVMVMFMVNIINLVDLVDLIDLMKLFDFKFGDGDNGVNFGVGLLLIYVFGKFDFGLYEIDVINN